MVENGYEVVWTKRSQKQMRQVFKHISKDSPKNASKVVQEIAEAVQKAMPNPEIYGPDKYKTDNDGITSWDKSTKMSLVPFSFPLKATFMIATSFVKFVHILWNRHPCLKPVILYERTRTNQKVYGRPT